MSYLLLQTGDRLTLQTGTGFLTLAGDAPQFPPGDNGGAATKRRRRINEELERDDEEIMRFVEKWLASV